MVDSLEMIDPSWRFTMQKAVSDFLFGLCFGMGFAIAGAVLHLIGTLIASAR